ncbi:MAG: CaiB/BaiF CoA-transferase family protein [Candidatus Latescibacterota bacterium]|nr:CaiB/BaiF CoA-transferase family protein [Candidatus Latescibacterota bacterium]
MPADTAIENEGQALLGITVLDFTRVLAGPFATLILADLGAEVIKVELPGHGDEARGFGPFVSPGDAGHDDESGVGDSAYFASVNRGKASVTLDLRTDKGREIALRLTQTADVLVENFRPGSMARFGLDFDAVHVRNPRLVYASISGFGQTGPYSRRPAYDVIIQAMSGLASVTGHPGQPPIRVGSSTADLSAALFSVIGILAALRQVEAGGTGQHLDVSMLDCQVALLENAIARHDVNGEVPVPLGSRHPAITPFQFFPARDGYVVVAAGNNRLWDTLCRALERPDLVDDPRFASNALRTENHAVLESELEQIFVRRGVDDWLEDLEAAGVPCGPVNDLARVVHDPHIAARGMLARTKLPGGGTLVVPASPLRSSSQPTRGVSSPPELGEHTEEILSQRLGIDQDEIAELRRVGVI